MIVNMTFEKPGNYARFYGLLKLMPGMDKDELKATLVGQFTNGRTESLREMTLGEYKAMCDAMNDTIEGGDSQPQLTAIRAELKRRRSAALHQIQLYGVDTADWERVNAFCLDKRIMGKMFAELGCEELETLTTKVRAMIRKKDK